jgi:hypothetical protein
LEKEKRKEKNKLKSYILWIKLTTYGGVASGHHINLATW